jgi:hypothetical protein
MNLTPWIWILRGVALAAFVMLAVLFYTDADNGLNTAVVLILMFGGIAFAAVLGKRRRKAREVH